MTTPIETLTSEEQVRLAECERVISSGLQTFRDVGLMILEIRDSRLYRASYKSFDHYIREKWGMSSRRAHQLCDAAEVVVNLELNNCSAPENEAQARELAKLPKEIQPAIMAEAIATATAESRGVTAKDIEDIAKAKRNDAEMLAAIGNPTPEKLQSYISPEPVKMSLDVVFNEFEAFLRMIDNQHYSEIEHERIFNKMECKLRHHRKSHQTPAAA